MNRTRAESGVVSSRVDYTPAPSCAVMETGSEQDSRAVCKKSILTLSGTISLVQRAGASAGIRNGTRGADQRRGRPRDRGPPSPGAQGPHPGMSEEIGEELLIKRAEEVLIESLMPFEMSHRAFRQAIVALRRMNERIEEEAKRIAQALHQEAGGLLASTHLALEELARDLSPKGSERLSLVKRLLEQMDEQLGSWPTRSVRPSWTTWVCSPRSISWRRGCRSGRGWRVTVEGSTEGRLSSAVETALYRNVQEALNNVIRHAKAARSR